MVASQIILVGAPGAGKSSVGRRIARELELPFVDVDKVIEAEQGRSIGDIFTTDGEKRFRELELAATLHALEGDGVISLGGGAVMTPEIREALVGRYVIWLRVSVSQAARRVGMNKSRPLLLGNVRGQLVQLLAQREPVYREVASVTIETDKRSIGSVTSEAEAAVSGS